MNAVINAPTTARPRFTPSALLILANIVLGLVIAWSLDGSVHALLDLVFSVMALTGLGAALATLSACARFDITAIIRAHIAVMQASLRRGLPVLPDEAALLVETLNEEIEDGDEDEDETAPRKAMQGRGEDGQDEQ